jgi:adenosylcobinamide-phosphate synthase
MTTAWIMLVAIGLDALLSWPSRIYVRIGHPVTWLGALITALERRLNHGGLRRAKGVAMMLIVVTLATLVASAVQVGIAHFVSNSAQSYLLLGVVAWPFIATRSMYDHVRAVLVPLKSGDIAAARFAVSMIVGRDPSALDDAGVSRAAIESLAENTSDGIVAPVFWGLVAGLPGIVAYKAINTLDSMIGHRSERYEAFGWASARIDDLVNLVPARITGMLFAVVSPSPLRSMRAMFRDARHHRSPNAGWPEAAMAGALNIRLSGPRVYDGQLSQERWVNGGGQDPRADDIARGLRLYLRAMGLMTVLVACLVEV